MINVEAYYQTIKKKTGKTPEDFKQLAAEKGFIVDGLLKPGLKATEVFNWLKTDFDLGRGHAMAIYHSFTTNQINVVNGIAPGFGSK